MTLTKIRRTSDFGYFVWRKREEAHALDGVLPEIVATDGLQIRRLVSQPHQINFQIFEDQETSKKLVQRIEESISKGTALRGYSVFTDEPALAILHTGDPGEPGWLAFPFGMIMESPLPTLPMKVANTPTLRLVGGAKIRWKRNRLYIDSALEQRGSAFLNSPDAFDLLSHISTWKLRAFHGAEEMEEVTIHRGEGEIEVASPTRIESSFILDELVFQKYRRDPTFKLWFIFEFDRDLFCLPPEWLTFWMRVDIDTTVLDFNQYSGLAEASLVEVDP